MCIRDRYYVARLKGLDDPELITEGELRALGSGARRAAARRHAAESAGRKARATVRRLQRAQARLAVELSRASELAEQHHSDVRRHRATLRALGHPEAVEGLRSWRHTASAIGTAAVAIAVLWVALSALGGA